MAAVALTGASNVTSGQSGSGTALTIAKPANVVNGSLMIAAVYPRLSSAAYATPPAGWALLAASTDTLVGWHALYWKVAGASEPSSYTWAGGAEGRHTGVIFIVTGADTASLLDVSGGYAVKVGNEVTAPSISPASSTALLIGAVAMNTTGNDPGTYSAPSGMTTVGDAATSTGGSDSTLYVAQQQLSTAGATGARVFAGTGTATFASGQSLLAAIRSSAATSVPGVATYDLTITASDSGAVADRTYQIDATGSTGTVSLVWSGSSRGTITESPTGVFSLSDPDDGDAPLDLLLTAAGSGGGANDTASISIARGGAAVLQRPAVFVRQSLTPGDWA